jgi:CDP-diacylglycerol--glycerol-3-phosphate 3-phosphatidyltransferase
MSDSHPLAPAGPPLPAPAHGPGPSPRRSPTPTSASDDRAGSTTFGPSAVLTPANGITALRLVVTPLLVALIVSNGPSWWTLALWAVLSTTDGIDGWVARRQGATRSGAFLDPLADKVVVIGALVALADEHLVPWAAVAVIAAREIAMSAYRVVVGRHGVSIPARRSAKVKTLLQDVAIGLCLIPPVATHRDVLAVAIWVAAALTVTTGVQYLVDGRRAGAARRAASAGLAAAPDGRRPS